MLDRTDKHLAVKAISHPVQFDQLPDFGLSASLKLHTAANPSQPGLDLPPIGPRLQRRWLERRRSLQTKCGQADDLRQGRRVEIALLIQRLRAGVLLQHRLVFQIPRRALDLGQLRSGVNLPVELDEILAVGDFQLWGPRCFGRLHRNCGIVHHDQRAVHFRAGQHEVPVGAIVLDQFLVWRLRRTHIGRQPPIVADQLGDDIAILRVHIVGVLEANRHPHGFVATLDHQSRVIIARDLDAVLDHHALKNRGLFLIVSGIDGDFCSGLERVGIADRERLFRHVAVQYDDLGSGDFVDRFPNRDGPNLNGVGDLPALAQYGQLDDAAAMSLGRLCHALPQWWKAELGAGPKIPETGQIVDAGDLAIIRGILVNPVAQQRQRITGLDHHKVGQIRGTPLSPCRFF